MSGLIGDVHQSQRNVANGFLGLDGSGKASISFMGGTLSANSVDLSLGNILLEWMNQGAALTSRGFFGSKLNIASCIDSTDPDATAGFVRAFSAAISQPGLALYIPSGNNYSLSSALTWSNQHLNLEGDGQSASILVGNHTGVILTINQNSTNFLTRVGKFGINSGVVSGSPVQSAGGLSVVYPPYQTSGSTALQTCDVFDLEIGGNILVSLNCYGWWQSKVSNVRCWNAPNVASNIAVQFGDCIDLLFHRVTAYDGNKGGDIGFYQNSYSEGIAIDKCSALANIGFDQNHGMTLPNGGKTAIDQMSIFGNSEFACTTAACHFWSIAELHLNNAHFEAQTVGTDSYVVRIDSCVSSQVIDVLVGGVGYPGDGLQAGIWLSDTAGYCFSNQMSNVKFGNLSKPIRLTNTSLLWEIGFVSQYQAGIGFVQCVFDETSASNYQIYDYVAGVGGSYPYRVFSMSGGWAFTTDFQIARQTAPGVVGKVVRFLAGGGTISNGLGIQSSQSGTAVALFTESTSGGDNVDLDIRPQNAGTLHTHIVDNDNVLKFKNPGNQLQFTTSMNGTPSTIGLMYGGTDGVTHFAGSFWSFDTAVTAGILNITNTISLGVNNQFQINTVSVSGTNSVLGHGFVFGGATDGLVHFGSFQGTGYQFDSPLLAAQGLVSKADILLSNAPGTLYGTRRSVVLDLGSTNGELGISGNGGALMVKLDVAATLTSLSNNLSVGGDSSFLGNGTISGTLKVGQRLEVDNLPTSASGLTAGQMYRTTLTGFGGTVVAIV